MKKFYDRITYRLKNSSKNKKENNSNSSRESLEKEIESFRKNKTLSRTKTQKGEEIKFFFNEHLTENKNSNCKISRLYSCKTKPIQKFNKSNKKNEFNFKDILLNYVNSPKYPTKKKEDDKNEKRNSIIYGDPETILTLNGDEENLEDNTKKDKLPDSSSSNSSSESESQSKPSPISDIKSNKKNNNIKEKNKLDKSKEESSYKSNTSKYDDSEKIFSNSNNSNIHNNSNNNYEEEEFIKINKKKIFINDNNKSSENNHIIILDELPKNKKCEYNIKKNVDSCFQKNSQKIKNSSTNTFTTAENTHNTHKTQNTNNSSFQSIKPNNKKIKYNYLCWKDLSLPKKIIIKNRSNSVKIRTIKEENKENLIKDKNIAIMIYKLKNLNISLEIEKSYSYYFKNLTNLQNQKSFSRNNSYNNENFLNNNQNKKLKDNQEKSFYYPNEYYINKKNTLHNKIHISNLFDKIREYKNNC